MLPRAWRRYPGVAALAALVALAGCGGDSGGGEASFDGGPVEIAEPGSTRPVGDRAFAEYSGLGPRAEAEIATTLAVTVREVNEGDASDIDGFGESTVPYYVHVEYENHGDGEIDIGAVGNHFTIRGSDGEEYDKAAVISIGGEFEPCPSSEPDATLAAEAAVVDCVVFAVTEGVAPEEVRFKGDFVAEDEPIAWTVE